MTLDEMRHLWLEEERLYREVAEKTAERLRLLTRDKGVYTEITYRVKDIDSLIKKAIRKNYRNPYDEIIDKAGARVVVRFLEEIELICEIIRQNFNVIKEENTADRLEPSEFGYLGVHFDTLTNDVTRPKDTTTNLPCEIQVHTLCQNVWAGQSHILAYKALVDIPRKIQRTLHRTSALLEAADQSFNDGHIAVINHPQFSNVHFLMELEKNFYRYTARQYDVALSLRSIAVILKSYHPDDIQPSQKVHIFAERHDQTLKRIYDEYAQIAERSAFLFQPEALAIFERLEADRYAIKNMWIEGELPLDELVRMGRVWGVEFAEES